MNKTREDIIELINSNAKESDQLEYKSYFFPEGKFSNLDERTKNKLFQEICSFTNVNGGDIIIGIREDDDHNPASFGDTGVNANSFEMWEQSFRLALSTRTRPSLHGVHCEYVAVNDNDSCIWISIPNSIQKPHACNSGSKDEFYIRNGNTSIPMSYDDIKHSFCLLDGIQEKVRDIRDTRLAMLLNDEIFENSSHDAGMILHIVPAWSLNDENYIDVRSVRNHDEFTLFSPPDLKGTAVFNADGLLMQYGHGERPVMSYVQVFHNGIVEVAEFRLLNDYKNGIIYKWYEMEELIAKKMYQYCCGLLSIGIPHGFYMYLTLVNVKHKRAAVDSWGGESPELLRNIIKTKVAKWDEQLDYPYAIMPLLNSLANTFGMERSLLYDSKLVPIKDRFRFVE